MGRHEWRRVAAVFSPGAANAKAKRQRIAQAVALMQRLVGAKTGTAVHQWTHKNMVILPNFGDLSQFDCVDEAVNTWTYLTMMQRAHLFRFHKVADVAFAGSPDGPQPAQHSCPARHGRPLFRDRPEPDGQRGAAAGHAARHLARSLASPIFRRAARRSHLNGKRAA